MSGKTPVRVDADVAIVGSGFAGALAAMALRARGRTVVLLERGRHPRFAIGESSTPLANLLLEQLCDRYGLESVRPLVSWGSWRRARPDVGCGLKRGFSFFFHEAGRAFEDDDRHARQLLVAASPHDEIADTHWYRPDVDAFLVAEAQRAGVTYLDEVALEAMVKADSHVTLCGTKSDRLVEVRARFVVDASGPRGFLHRTLGLEEQPLRWMPPTQTLYAHFTGVERWDSLAQRHPGEQAPPYPVDAAALHHVFDGGWIWVLRFESGITSAGAATEDDLARELRLGEGAPAWDRLLARVPSVEAQFHEARAVTPFIYAPRLAYRTRRIVGTRWAMLPSAAGVIDPLLSTGFPLTLLGVHRLVEALDRCWESPALAGVLAHYADATVRELDATEQLVGALYTSMDDPTMFKRLALLYFAAASYSETVRRLGHPERAAGFLLCDDQRFGGAMRSCAEAARGRPKGEERTALLARIDAAIEPIDVAGLSDRDRHDWYPVKADDMMTARAKVQATRDDISALVERCGLSLSGVVVAVLLALTLGCQRHPTLSDEAYRQAVVAFHTGVAAMQTSQEVLAREQLDTVTILAAHEPAGWANLGLLLLRQQEIEPALQRLQRAEVLAPDHAGIQRLLALAAGRNGDLTAAIGHWKKASAADPGDLKAAYALALDLERAGGDDNEAAALRAIEALATRTGNLAVQVEFARLAAKRNDPVTLQRAVDALDRHASSWPDDIRARFTTVKDAASADAASAGRPIAFLKNFLLRLPVYRQAIARVSTPREEVGEPLHAFVVLPNPRPQAAPADASLTFDLTPLSTQGNAPQAQWTGAVSLTGEGAPSIATYDGETLRLQPTAGPGAALDDIAVTPAGPLAGGVSAVLAADLTYDFRSDLVVASSLGTRLLRQGQDGRFTDITSSSGLPIALVRQPATAVWPADIDLDGDLDVVLGVTDGPPQVLRNNGDETFATLQAFVGLSRTRGFVWADLDGDGVPDAALLQADGVVRTFINMRGGAFEERPMPEGIASAAAIATVAGEDDGVMDVLTLGADGTVRRVVWSDEGTRWVQHDVAHAAPPTTLAVGEARLLTADLDNNGAVDLIVTSAGWTAVLLGHSDGSFQAIASQPLHTFDVADLDDDGRLELIGIDTDGRVVRGTSRGDRSYRWQVLRPRAATAFGDQRINAFGIGGEVEVRTGLHVQKRLITSPIVHVGLGEATRADVVRLLWPNGTLQSEFGLEGDRSIAATQRLKGSCPWLFAWDGQAMSFVTDVLWRSPLGLRINAQSTADVSMTEDRVKVRGNQLAARDGAYDLRITAELWETHFFDLVSMLVVDHPADTEIWVDERFAAPPPSNEIIVTGHVQPLVSARDDQGHDVGAILASRDDRHLDFAGRGRYQGIVRDHFVELELPADIPRTGPVWLIAQGWIHPTDSSINVAISQGAHAAPQGLALHVADVAGVFHVVDAGVGFPAGKDKTILLDVAKYLPASGPVRLRLATNLEIFWDRIGWAEGRPDVPVAPVRLLPLSAELRYRGYSVTHQAEGSAPERPRYLLEGTMPRWRDLEGYHTRFGDVRELVLGVDDRYVIMNAGDELALRFAEAGSVADGRTRDFIVVSDGWEKDGDYNTTFSRTVLPLPTHDTGRYDRAPRRLEDDPVYLKHPDDFAVYHTRYVTPDRAREALRVPSHSKRP